MLRKILNTFYNITLEAEKSRIGNIDDAYFDDKKWKIRYLVSDSIKFLPARRVLISSISIKDINYDQESISINHSKKEIEQSPVVNQGLLPSREIEIELKNYFNWPVYWGSGYLIGEGDLRSGKALTRGTKEEVERDPNLRSCNGVIGYEIESDNNTIGYVQDYILDDQTWDIRYLVIDLHGGFENNIRLVATNWIQECDWNRMTFMTELTLKEILKSPEYNQEDPVKHDYAKRLYEYYNKPKYWL